MRLTEYFFSSLTSLSGATGVQKFETVVFNAVKDKVREGILELIEKERKGEAVDRELLKSVVNVSSRHPLLPTLRFALLLIAGRDTIILRCHVRYLWKSEIGGRSSRRGSEKSWGILGRRASTSTTKS
jgi:hypothetical protein